MYKETQGEVHFQKPSYRKFRLYILDLQKVYSDAGQFYWGKRSAWMNKKKIFNHYSSIIQIPHQRANDIDTIDDYSYGRWHRRIEPIA